MVVITFHHALGFCQLKAVSVVQGYDADVRRDGPEWFSVVPQTTRNHQTTSPVFVNCVRRFAPNAIATSMLNAFMYLKRRNTPAPRKQTHPVIAELIAKIAPNREWLSYNQVVEICEIMMSAASDDDEQFKERCKRLIALAWTS
jgi:hypothetical protein